MGMLMRCVTVQLVELASDSSLNGDSLNQGGLVAQAEANQLVVAGYGHYVDGRGEHRIPLIMRSLGGLLEHSQVLQPSCDSATSMSIIG